MNKKSKTYQRIKPLVETILTQNMLCIDPSTGSYSSMPGYALFKKGKKIESGIIEVDPKLNKSLKLYEIARTIREDFSDTAIDLLVVEYIPPMSFKGGMSGVAIMSLQKSIGAIMGAMPFTNLLEIPVASWKAFKPKDYVKTDEYDSICLGLCAIGIATWIVENDS